MRIIYASYNAALSRYKWTHHSLSTITTIYMDSYFELASSKYIYSRVRIINY